MTPRAAHGASGAPRAPWPGAASGTFTPHSEGTLSAQVAHTRPTAGCPTRGGSALARLAAPAHARRVRNALRVTASTRHADEARCARGGGRRWRRVARPTRLRIPRRSVPCRKHAPAAASTGAGAAGEWGVDTGDEGGHVRAGRKAWEMGGKGVRCRKGEVRVSEWEGRATYARRGVLRARRRKPAPITREPRPALRRETVREGRPPVQCVREPGSPGTGSPHVCGARMPTTDVHA